jgi:type IV secretion system protein VirB9
MKVPIVSILALVAIGFSASAADTVAVARYHDRDLIPIKTKLRFTTLVVLPPGEEIDEVTCGDKQYWVIEGKDNILHVKPAKEGAVTNVNVVLKSHAVYSFVVEEIGTRGDPELKIVLGEDEALRLRAETKALEARIASLSAEKDAALAQAESKRQADLEAHRAEMARVEAEMPARILSFLTKQKFDYWCVVKTNVCLAAVFATESETYVIGHLGIAPSFSGTDAQGKYHSVISFKKEGDVYKLDKSIVNGRIFYDGKATFFSVR